MIFRNRIPERCPSYLVAVDSHSNIDLLNDAAMYLPGALHSIAHNNSTNAISSNSVAVDLSGETETGVEQKFIVHTIDHDHEFEFLEIGHIGECAEVPFNVKAWCSIIAGSWITQHLRLRIIQGRDSFRIFNDEGRVLIDGVIVDGNPFVSKWICGVGKGYLCRSCVEGEPKVDMISLLTNYTISKKLTNSGWITTNDTTKVMSLRIN